MITRDKEVNNNEKDLSWELIGLVILPIRFVQGFIFWAAGSRRFIYAPQKLDPNAKKWLANKLQSAMPGALFDLGNAIDYLLKHFDLLYSALIIFSIIELLSGTALLIGFFTRTAAFITALLSIALMLIFGWQGGTCLDEWTMASCTLVMGLTLVLSGGSIYSIDHQLIKRNPRLLNKTWFKIFASGPIKLSKLNYLSLFFLIFSIIFICGTYNYYRGSLISRYHAGPVSPTVFHISLAHGHLSANGEVMFTMNIDGGTSSVPNYIVRINLINSANHVIRTWNDTALRSLPFPNIKNKYDYNQITTGPFGLVAPVSAKALIILPSTNPQELPNDTYYLQVITINGKRWNLPLKR